MRGKANIIPNRYINLYEVETRNIVNEENIPLRFYKQFQKRSGVSKKTFIIFFSIVYIIIILVIIYILFFNHKINSNNEEIQPVQIPNKPNRSINSEKLKTSKTPIIQNTPNTAEKQKASNLSNILIISNVSKKENISETSNIPNILNTPKISKKLKMPQRTKKADITFIFNIKNHVYVHPYTTIDSIKSCNLESYQIIIVVDYLFNNLNQLKSSAVGDQFIVIEQNKNQNLHEALLIGYEKSYGDYIMFVEQESILSYYNFINDVKNELINKKYDIINFKRAGHDNKIESERKNYSQPEIFDLYIKENYDKYHYGKLIKREYLDKFFEEYNNITDNYYANNEIMKDYLYKNINTLLYINKEVYVDKGYDYKMYDFDYMLNNFKYLDYLINNNLGFLNQEQFNIIIYKKFNEKKRLYNNSVIIDNSEYYINILRKIIEMNKLNETNKILVDKFDKRVMYFYYHLKDNIKNISNYINECTSQKGKVHNNNFNNIISFIIPLEDEFGKYKPLLYSINNLDFQNYSIVFTFYKEKEQKYKENIDTFKELEPNIMVYIEEKRETKYNNLLINAINKSKSNYTIIIDTYDFIILKNSFQFINFNKSFNYIILNAFCYQKYFEYMLDDNQSSPNSKYLKIFEKTYILNYLENTTNKFLNSNNNTIDYKDPTNIEYSINKNFLFPTFVSMHTALQSKNINTFYHFYIMHSPDLTKIEKKILLSLHNKYIGFEIHFLDMKNEYLQYNNLWLYPPSSFYRVDFADMMPNLNRILHLDCDTVILDDLSPNMKKDMGGKTLLGFEEIKGVINTGTVIIDLQKYRENKYGEKIRNVLQRSPASILPDQMAINRVMRDRGRIDARYGMSYCFWQRPSFWQGYKSSNIYPLNEIVEAYNNPAVIHYFSSCVSKPWFSFSYKKVWINGYEWYDEIKRTDYAEEIYRWAIK